MSTEKLDLSDFIDGVVPSKRPGENENCVTFVTSIPHQEVAFDGGFIVRFVGPQFTHDHPRVVAVLKGLAARNTGIFVAASAEEAPKVVKAGDPVLKDGAKIDTAAKS